MGQPIVVFVHGCTQGPTSWDRVREALSHTGVESLAVDLRPDEFGEAGALDCAAHITRMTEALERVVVVATSCSGILIPIVTLLRDVDRLVFVCSGLPDIGRSATEQIAQDGVLCEDWATWVGPTDHPQTATRFMFNDCSGDVLDWSLTTVRLFLPRKAYDEVTPLSAWPAVPSTYILGTEDRIISAAWARSAACVRLGTSPIEIPTGHCPQNSQPVLLAGLIRGLVVRQPAGPPDDR